MRLLILLLAISLSCLSSCAVKPKGSYSEYPVPKSPDYSNLANWAALPEKKDNADRTPASSYEDIQKNAPVDVFFIHPTTYTGKKKQKNWNGPTQDTDLNAATDDGTILYQASLFNGVGRVFAPRYRQAHLYAYYSKDKVAAKEAFALAYQDVAKAFQYYLEHYNQGRPFIIASHSQGTTHAGPLIREFIDGKPLQKQLVAAYLVGMPVAKNYFKQVPVCESPEQTGCFCSWRSYKKGHIPQKAEIGEHIAVTNPLNWKTDNTYVDKTSNKGGVLYNFEKIFPALADAQVHQGILWVTKPKFPGSFLFNRANYHVADFNFYYLNVRENASLRAKEYLKENSKETSSK